MIAAIVLSILPYTHAAAMTIDEAYRAIPHQRTIFEDRSPGIDPKEAPFLREFFEQVDLAMVARVRTLMWFQSDGGRGAPFHQYEERIGEVLGHLKAMRVPGRLVGPHRLVIEAIEGQRHYFAEWQAARDQGQPFQPRLVKGGGGHPLIQSSSGKLIAAYNALVRLHPQATAHNRQAFFDYLCALDFI
jgi:hypothetical protein